MTDHRQVFECGSAESSCETREREQGFFAIRASGVEHGRGIRYTLLHPDSSPRPILTASLKLVWQLGVWYQRTFGKPDFKSGPFMPPQPPENESDELRAELEALSRNLADYRVAHDEQAQQLEALKKRKDTGESGRFRKFSRGWIAERDDSLDISWLKDDKAESSADLPEPAVLAASAMEEMAAIMEDPRGILAELGEEAGEEVGA